MESDLSAVDAALSLENAITIEELFNELSPLLKETAELHFLQGYSFEEIAIKLTANPETIKKRCKRAMAQLREIWQTEAH